MHTNSSRHFPKRSAALASITGIIASCLPWSVIAIDGTKEMVAGIKGVAWISLAFNIIAVIVALATSGTGAGYLKKRLTLMIIGVFLLWIGLSEYSAVAVKPGAGRPAISGRDISSAAGPGLYLAIVAAISLCGLALYGDRINNYNKEKQ